MDLLTQPLQAFFHERLIVNRIADNRYEIKTPYKDLQRDIVLFASFQDGRVRLTDDGYLVKNYLAVQDDPIGGRVRISTGVIMGHGNTPHAPKFEGDEFVAHCDTKDFGEAVAMMAHGILFLGTSKLTASILTRAFTEIMQDEEAPPAEPAIFTPTRRYDA